MGANQQKPVMYPGVPLIIEMQTYGTGQPGVGSVRSASIS